jgi:hypothetical protein
MAEKNPIIQANLRAMEMIWSQVPKEVKNGIEYITYIKNDLPYLYYSGLVDTQRYKLEDWQQAFEDCLGEDGRYWISHEKMLSLGKFRYGKTVNEPFDPFKMRMGRYEVDRLWRLFESSVIPSCALPREYLKNVYDQMVRQHKSFKQMFSEKDLKKLKDSGQEIDFNLSVPDEHEGSISYVTVTREHLENLKKMLDTYPSPRRKLEISVQQMRQEKLQQLADIAASPQKSAFESGPDFRNTAKKSLKDMLIKASENVAAGRKTTGEVINVGDVQKKKRPPVKF